MVVPSWEGEPCAGDACEEVACEEVASDEDEDCGEDASGSFAAEVDKVRLAVRLGWVLQSRCSFSLPVLPENSDSFVCSFNDSENDYKKFRCLINLPFLF